MYPIPRRCGGRRCRRWCPARLSRRTGSLPTAADRGPQDTAKWSSCRSPRDQTGRWIESPSRDSAAPHGPRRRRGTPLEVGHELGGRGHQGSTRAGRVLRHRGPRTRSPPAAATSGPRLRSSGPGRRRRSPPRGSASRRECSRRSSIPHQLTHRVGEGQHQARDDPRPRQWERRGRTSRAETPPRHDGRLDQTPVHTGDPAATAAPRRGGCRALNRARCHRTRRAMLSRQRRQQTPDRAARTGRDQDVEAQNRGREEQRQRDHRLHHHLHRARRRHPVRDGQADDQENRCCTRRQAEGQPEGGGIHETGLPGRVGKIFTTETTETTETSQRKTEKKRREKRRKKERDIF